ncbi:MAG TPA: lamin tail domain-containing protein [Lacipirellulaceae bacterium]|nr:lamin tail domain-containing protein [Lacipirellulaceae bacterium]
MRLRRWQTDRSRVANHAPFGRRSAARGFSSRRFRLQFERLEPRLAMAGVVINEFLAINEDGILDQDDHRSDWIELKNTDAAPVNINGWHLADSVDQWQLPNITLNGGQHLLIFASGKDRAVVGQELHTNFQLDGDGEALKLLMPDGTTVVHAYDPYPPQLEDVSYGLGTGSVVTDMLIDESAPVRVHVPSAASGIDSTWYTTGFNDSGWTEGTAGVGFDLNSSGTPLDPYINLDVQSLMWDFPETQRKQSAYIRIPFVVANPADLESLLLRIRYEDGYGLYLNGTRLQNAERAAPGALTWNAVATASRTESAAVTYTDIDLTPFRSLLQAGGNVLAIHGLNRNNISDDFLIDPVLQANRSSGSVQGYMVTPTPGTSNQQGTLGFVADTKFSVDRGFYTSAFNVEITSATEGSTIRYTVDGSAPTATTGLIYNPLSPPLISTTTTLRAAAYKTGFTPSNVDTQTYIFLDDVLQQDGVGLPPYAPWGKSLASPVPDWEVDPNIVNHPLYAGTIRDDLKAVSTVSLVLPWNDWFGAGGQGIYIQGTSIERIGSFELFSADGSENYESIASMEIQGGGAGGTSADRWKADKLSIQVKFKQPGPTKLDAPLFTNPDFDEGAASSFDTFILDAVLNYSWHHRDSAEQRANAKFIQDQVVADFQNLMGGQGPHGRYVHLYLNGLYWGMYYLHERPDDTFAESYLGGDKDDYDVVKHNGNTPVSGDATAPGNYATLMSAVRQNMQVPANYAAVEQLLDIDDFIDYMIANYYSGNTDWAHKNWYASFNRVDPNGRWRFHSWDAEHVFKNVNENVTGRNDTGGPTEIHHLLIGNPEYRLRFADRVQNHFYNGGVLTPAAAGAVYAARAMEIDRAIVGESARWGDNRQEPAFTRAHWRATQDNLLSNYFPNRSGIVLNQFASLGWSVPIEAPLMSQYGGTVEPGYQLTLSLPPSRRGVPIYYTLDGSDPRDPATNLPSAGALLYAAPITIDAQVQVNARIFIDDAVSNSVNEWSPIVAKEFFLPTPFPVRITELHYNPVAAPGGIQGEDLEFVELMNVGSQTINLAGVQITQFGETPYTFASRFLAPGERIVVARNPSVFQSVYGTGINLASTGYGAANLSNGGERIALLGPLGESLQDFVFDDEAPWPTSPDGGGYSLQIIDPLGDASDPANWRASNFLGGSPGGTDDSVPGDYDGNGLVEQADAAAWHASFGMTAEPGTGADGNRNGIVDAADFVVWRARMSAAQAAGAANSSLAVAAASGSADSEPAGGASVSARGATDGIPFPDGNRSRSNPSRRIVAVGRMLGGSTPATDGLDLILVSQLGEDAHRKFDGLASPRVAIDTHLGLTPAQNCRDILESASAVWEDEAWLEGLSAARLM